MKINRITAGVAALVMGAVTPAFFMDTDTNVVCAEKVYDVKLSAETVEIDINDIPENREVLVGINLNNNPGCIGISFLLRKDSRLSCDEIQAFEIVGGKCGVNHSFHDNGNVLEVSLLPHVDYNNGELFSDNGQFIKLKLKLPNEVNSGDYFEVTPLTGNFEDKEAFFYRSNDFDSFFGRENFAEPVSGGIRITGQKAEPSPSPQPEPSPSPSPEQKPSNQATAGNSPSPSNGGSSSSENNGSENRQETGNVTTVSTEAVSSESAVSTSEITSVSETLAETNVSTSVVTSETTEDTGVTVTEVSETETIKTDNEKKSSKTVMTALFSSLVVVIAVTGAVIIKRKLKKEN